MKEKAKPGHDLTQRQRARNRRFGKVRAKVEPIFRIVKCQFGYRKVRYRGIAKNGAQLFALFALANLYLVRGRLASAASRRQPGAPRLSRQHAQFQRKSSPGRH